MWHEEALKDLLALLEEDDSVKAVIMTGSLADPDIQPDAWSDIDLKVVLDDNALDGYFPKVDWAEPLGKVLAVSRSEDENSATLRMCFEDFRRFDMTFIPASRLSDDSNGQRWWFQGKYKILTSRIDNLESMIESTRTQEQFEEISPKALDNIVNEFWFKSTVAVTKVMRDDLLVALHLALDMERDCLLLKMIQRDSRYNTNIHREGGWGNELLKDLATETSEYSPAEILQIVERSVEMFDRLAAELSDQYEPRAKYFLEWIKKTKAQISLS